MNKSYGPIGDRLLYFVLSVMAGPLFAVLIILVCCGTAIFFVAMPLIAIINPQFFRDAQERNEKNGQLNE